jgi:hypothetical protein
MPLVKCPRTGVLFNNDTTPVHPSAMKAEEADYEIVLEFITQNPGASIGVICESTEVSEDCVRRMVARGRVENINYEEAERRQQEQTDQMQRHSKRRGKRARGLMKLKLPKKKKVEFGGTVRSVLEQKRRF